MPALEGAAPWKDVEVDWEVPGPLLQWATGRALRGGFKARAALLGEDDRPSVYLLEHLAGDPAAHVRAALAGRRDLPEHLIAKLAGDQSAKVVAALRRAHPDPVPGGGRSVDVEAVTTRRCRLSAGVARSAQLSRAEALSLLAGPDARQRAWLLADNQSLDAAVMARIAEIAAGRDGEAGIWARVARQVNTPAAVLAAMIDQGRPWADLAAGNPNTPLDAVGRFVERWPRADWKPVAARADLGGELAWQLAGRFIADSDWGNVARLLRQRPVRTELIAACGDALAASGHRGGYRAAVLIPALVAAGARPEVFSPLSWSLLGGRHRAMIADRQLAGADQVEMAVALWDSFEGTVAAFVTLVRAACAR